MRKFSKPKSPDEQRLYDFDLNKHVKRLQGTSFFQEQLDNGKFIYADRFTLIRECHILMKKYGMGGCRTFTEFIEMVNQEDPAVINTLIALITEDNRAEAGFKPREIILDHDTYGDQSFTPRVKNIEYDAPEDDIAHSQIMGLMSNFGGTYSEMKKRLEDHQEKYGINVDSFEDVNSETIHDPNFDLKSVKQRLQKAKDQALNIRITPDMWMKNKKS